MQSSVSSNWRWSNLPAWTVWLFRVAVGAVFVISGWSKCIDLWGFVFKIEEYLSAWHLSIWIPREVCILTAGTLSVTEFVTGVMLVTGSLRRVSVWYGCLLMAFMLPLTAYIAVADPIPDCGCFGDFLILSNTATFIKNIVLSAMLLALVVNNRRCAGLFPAALQWIVITLSTAYVIIVGIVGLQVQPLLDFRPYPVGSRPAEAAEDVSEPMYVYSKDGQTRTFTLDALPDSTWTYVGDVSGDTGQDTDRLEVYDADGEAATDDVFDAEGDMAVLVIDNPAEQFLSRAHFNNELYQYLVDRGAGMAAVLGARDSLGIARWKDLAVPRFEVYTADVTALRTLVRGNAALVYLRDGRILWKRSLMSIPPDTPLQPDPENILASMQPVDDGYLHGLLTGVYIALMMGVFLLGLSPKCLRIFSACRFKKKS